MKRIGLLWNRNNIERPGSAGTGSVSIKVTNYQRHPLSYRELAESNIFKGLENDVVVGGVDAVISEDRDVSVFEVTGDHIDVVIIVDIADGDIKGTAGRSENGRLKPEDTAGLAEQDGDTVRTEVGNGDIETTIAVEIGGRRVNGESSDLVACRFKRKPPAALPGRRLPLRSDFRRW